MFAWKKWFGIFYLGITLTWFLFLLTNICEAQVQKGDVTGDGKVDGKDALLLAQHLKNPTGNPLTDLQKESADVFPVPGVGGRSVGDGRLTEEDVQQLLRFMVGLIGESTLQGQVIPVITHITPASGPVGTQVEIEGQFFTAGKPKDNVVTFSGVEATVSEATNTRLIVQVPVGATTGYVVVTTPIGTTPSRHVFTVTGLGQGRFEPPAGMNATDFVIVNTYGYPTQIQQQQQQGLDFTIPIRTDMPLVTVAAHKDPARNISFFAVTLDDNQPFTINTESTTQAIVFMNPFLMTIDSLLAERMLDIIRRDEKAQALSQLIAQLYTQDGDPFENPAFIQAYGDAVLSVGSSAAIQSLMRERQQALPQLAPPRNALVYSLDMDFLRVIGVDRTRKVTGIPLNPVDWLVLIQGVDVDKAFPNGRKDFDSAWRENRTLVNYPLRSDGFEKLRAVPADLLFKRVDPIAYLMGGLFEYLTGEPPEQQYVDFTDSDAIYLLRGLGPALTPDDEHNFAWSNPNLQETYVNAIAINLVTAAMDWAIGVIDVLEVLEVVKESVFPKLIAEAIKKVYDIKGGVDPLVAIFKLHDFLLQELASTLATQGLEVLKKSIGSVAKLARVALPFYKALKILSSIGQVAERLSGFGRTTPIETAFIMIGDPFKIDIVSVTPSGGSPGDDFDIVVRIGHKDEPQAIFELKDPRISFIREAFSFDGQVKEIQKIADGWRISVHLPIDIGMKGAPDGEYDMTILAQGRHGEGKFTLVSRPTVMEMTPTEGFAAVDEFEGREFTGDSVAFKGFGFSAADTFIFANGKEAKDKQGSSGNVAVRVPKGANSGPITIRRRVSSTDIREGQSPPFMVFPAPVIKEMKPVEGPVGTTVVLTVENRGSDFDLIRVRFKCLDGTWRDGEWLSLIGRDRLTVIVPFLSREVTEDTTVDMIILTPAGQAQQSFTAKPGRAAGSIIYVGGDSVVSLYRAGEIAGREIADEGKTAGFKITEQSLEYLKSEDVPDDVLEKLQTLENQEFTGEKDFLDKLKETIGDEQTVRFKSSILEHAKKIIERVDDDKDFIRIIDPKTGQEKIIWFDWVVPNDLEEGDFVSPDGGFGESPRWPVGPNFADTILITGEVSGDIELCGSFDTLRTDYGGVIKGTLIITGNSNIVNCTFRGSSSHGIIIKGNNNQVGYFCEGCGGDAVRIEGGISNTVGGTAIGNGGSGVVITDGAIGNSIQVEAIQNDGNGVTIIGGALGNKVYASTGQRDFETDELTPNSGNKGHGILVTDNAASNIINGDFSGNGGDGIRLDGAEVKQNQVGDGVYTIANGGNGCTVANGATDNKVGVIAKENGENGIALMASKGTEVMKFSSSRGNKKYGILVSGVTDEKTSIGWTSSSENSIASVRFENGTKNVHYLGEIVNESIGLEMDGEDVVKNTVLAGVELCTDGVVITRAQRNKLTLYTSGCGTAVVMKGAKENELVLSTVGKEVLPQGDALHLLETLIDEDTTEGSDNNYITATIGNNQNGIVVENSKDNRFDNLRISNIRAHGVILQGSGTIGNRITNARIGLPFTAEFGSVGGGVGGDGIRIQGGASNNNVGTDAARGAEISNCVGAGIRIMGEGTRENVILGCSIKLGSTQEQEAGIIIEDKSEDIIIGGFTDKERNEISSNKDGIIMRGTYKVLIHNNRIESNSNNGILVENTSDVLIGGSHQSSPNDISSNVVGIQFKGADTTNCRVIGNRIFQNTDGVVIRDNAANNVIENGNILKENKSGIRIEKASQNRILNNVIHDNNLAGVFLSDGAADNLLRGNSIFGNATGVQVTGTTTLRNTIRNNSITANTGKGISLSNGGNREIPPPVLTSFSSNSVIGTASAPDGSSVEIFKDPADEGEKPIAAAAIANGRFRVPVDLKVVQVGLLFQLTGTVTDPSGNTSEFGLVQQFPLFVSEIVFTSTRDENQEIYLQDGFSLFPFRLTNNPADDFSPVFSPNTPEIAFVSTRDGNPEIYTMPPQAGRVATRLTNHSAPDYDPAWSPNGNKIVFVSERDGNPEIYLMNADGTNITRLTNNAGVDRFPVFSPDGTKIAFASNRTGNFEIFVMNADGSNLRNVTQNPADDIQPAWSPDGQLIAFVSERDGNAEIYTMKTDGSQAMRLTNHAAADVSPSWLAGGEGLVFASDRDEGFELYLMGRSGGEAERLTVSNGDNTQPHAALRRQL